MGVFFGKMSIQIILKQNGLRECLPLRGGLTLFSEMREAVNMHTGELSSRSGLLEECVGKPRI